MTYQGPPAPEDYWRQYMPPPATIPPPTKHKAKQGIHWWTLIIGLVIGGAIGGAIAAGASGSGKSNEAAAVTISSLPSAAQRSSSAASSPASTPTQQANGPAKIGQTVRIKASDGEGTVTIHAIQLNASPAGTIFGAATNGQYVLIDVTIATTKGTINYNPLYFSAASSDNHRWTSSLINIKEPGLSSGDLPAGEAVRGYVTFDLQNGPVSRIYLTDGPIGKQLAIWAP